MRTRVQRLVKFCTIIAVVIVGTVALQSIGSANALNVPDSEYNALVALYNSTNGSGWKHNTNWLTDSAPWYGVTVTDGHVTSIGLWENNLVGTIPPEIGNLSNLEKLVLEDNRLSGQIPAEIGNLANLTHLYLDCNDLSGKIPPEIGNLSNLTILALYMNQLTGGIPTEIFNMHNLASLDLMCDQLSGEIPADIAELSNLSYLDLSCNQFSGQIPTEIGDLTNLECLDLSGNQLTGEIPSAIGNLSNLEVLYVTNNLLSGQVPSELGKLNKLDVLRLADNKLTGEIPVQLGNMPTLREINLSDNQLTGEIPPGLNKPWLYLSDNHLTGSIPPEIFSSNLEELDLSNNQLSGTIPPGISDVQCSYMYLDRNQLSGEIPPSIVNNDHLYYQCLGIYYNCLTSSDPAVISYLQNRALNWQITQTVNPTNVSASICGNGSIFVSWLPISFSAGAGYYEVGYSSVAGGPYTFDPENRTTDKYTSSVTIDGLDTEHTLYFVVRTISLPGNYNQSTLTSALSSEAAAIQVSNNILGVSDKEFCALEALYNGSRGSGWTKKTNWLTNNAPWYGVTVENGHVTRLELSQNNLNGKIQTRLGDLTHLYRLDLSHNTLSGPIPADLGNLTNLQHLDLSVNPLSGSIPAEIGNLTNLQHLLLSNDALSGDFPAEISNLINLTSFDITSDDFAVEVPSWITNMVGLQQIELQYNALRSTNPSVLTFLSQRGSGLGVQAVPPCRIAISPTGDQPVISWAPVSNALDPYFCRYEVGYSTTPGGPYDFDDDNCCPYELSPSVQLSGIDITKPAYFVVRTIIGHSFGDWVASVPSPEVELISDQITKKCADGSGVVMGNMVVTGRFHGYCYVESKDRMCGIRVEGDLGDAGQSPCVNIWGTIHTDENCERYVEPSSVEPVNSDITAIRPIYMTNRNLGGSGWNYDATSGAGQRGIEGAKGLNNIGLLLKTTGTVTHCTSDGFYLDDGSNLNDGSSYKGVFVDTSGSVTYPEGSKIWVVGISSCLNLNDHIVRRFLLTDSDYLH